jgi:hypothetical protein
MDNYIISNLNENCEYKNDHGFYKWTLDDIKGETPRDYCYWWFRETALCNNCKKTLKNKEYQTQNELYDLLHQMANDIDKIKKKLNID